MKKAALALLLLTTPLAVGADSEQRVAHVGFLGGSTPKKAVHLLQAFKQGLSELGYVESHNIITIAGVGYLNTELNVKRPEYL